MLTSAMKKAAFLSHAKQDIDKDPNLLNDLVVHLQATQPVSAWVDSGQI